MTWLPFPGAQTGGIRAQFENLARAGTEDAERQAAEEKERRRKREAVERQMEKEKVWMAGCVGVVTLGGYACSRVRVLFCRQRQSRSGSRSQNRMKNQSPSLSLSLSPSPSHTLSNRQVFKVV